MSLLGKRKKPNWSCPVCFEAFDIEKSIIPYALTKCRVVAHMICFHCVNTSINAFNGITECPICHSKENDGENPNTAKDLCKKEMRPNQTNVADSRLTIIDTCYFRLQMNTDGSISAFNVE